MAEFLPAYNLERKHEGYYVNNPADKGGETYAGVARNYWPNWAGWPTLDAYKRQIGRPLKTNESVPGMEMFVQSFYKALWDGKNFSAINSQEVANIVYDWFINSGSSGIKGTQQVLRDSFKAPVIVDGNLGPDTIRNINLQNAAKLNDAIKEKRIAFYYSLVARNPSQQTFLKGWLARINSFPTLTKAGLGLGAILLMAGLFFLVRNRNKK